MQKYTVYHCNGEQRGHIVLVGQNKTIEDTVRPKVTIAAGIANVADSLSSFAIQSVRVLHSNLRILTVVVASNSLPICVSGLSSSSAASLCVGPNYTIVTVNNRHFLVEFGNFTEHFLHITEASLTA